jgi:pimeloyl-ACP methyl ester carboxylesterase
MRFPGLLSLLLATLVLSDLTPFDEWKHLRVALEDVSIHVRYHGTGPPILLVHGFPQHSLTWHTIGPILAQNYTLIAVDNRGCGSSSIPRNDDYSAETVSNDLVGVLNFLKINQTYVFGHDKGVGVSTALAFKNRSLVKRLGIAEYALPGTGTYEAASNPSPTWDTYSNWQLAFFSVPDVAQYFIQGKEKEMLAWYFFHASYTGNSAISAQHLERYTTEISKPGFLRSGFGYFAETGVDGKFFNDSINSNKLTQPVLALGGETSFSPESAVYAGMGVVGVNSSSELIPKSGHWIGKF